MKYLIIYFLLISQITNAKNIKLFIIDTGVDLSHKEIKEHVIKNPINVLDYVDNNGHGTHVSGIALKGTCPEVELESCSYFDIFSPKGSEDLYLECLRLAVKKHPNVVNISSGGEEPSDTEYSLLKILSDLGTKIVVAAGNEGKDLSLDENNYYPAKYNILNLIPVGNLGSKSSNFGLKNEIWMPGTKINSTLPNGKFGEMSGTSQSTAAETNLLLLEMCHGR